METVNIHQAKTNLSRLVERVSKGESVIIAKAGKPMVKLVPLDETERRPGRRIGFMAGEFTTPDDFDRMGEDEIAEMFYGRP
ncbi:type II toxin-antitoxin system Phd/YefM family antitoxin [Bosea sp. LjRoot237]|uniref:type II toxin-antitoxin system Phd/YefM family antitoxin n=1 Tax=Bosea sp. LjRoot237 TaxID=3342292 RepID=UPI003ECE299E